MKKIIVPVFIVVIFIAGCSNLILKPSDFSWPVEAVLKVDKNGVVQEKRYSLSFDTKELFLAETGDSLGFMNKDLHVIRNSSGYYFMTADQFKNVYVFRPDEGSLSMTNKIVLSDSVGIKNPAFNQRPPDIELIYDNNKKINLTNEGIKEENNK